MLKLLGYLKQCKKSVIAIVVLLIVQAWCDLALPQYTSDIVDVGIQQGGIAWAAPEEMRSETWEALRFWMTDEEAGTAARWYEPAQDGVFRRTADGKKAQEEIQGALRIPMVLVSWQRQAMQQPDLSGLVQGLESMDKARRTFFLETGLTPQQSRLDGADSGHDDHFRFQRSGRLVRMVARSILGLDNDRNGRHSDHQPDRS